MLRLLFEQTHGDAIATERDLLKPMGTRNVSTLSACSRALSARQINLRLNGPTHTAPLQARPEPTLARLQRAHVRHSNTPFGRCFGVPIVL